MIAAPLSTTNWAANGQYRPKIRKKGRITCLAFEAVSGLDPDARQKVLLNST
jgi:hypothetical protein